MKQYSHKKHLIATDGKASKFKGAMKCKGAANFAGNMNSIGSLGFLITDNTGNPFVRCYGQLAGLNPQ